MIYELAKPRNKNLLPATLIWSVFVLGVVEASTESSPALEKFPILADPRVGPAAFGGLAVHAMLCPTDRRKRIVIRVGIVLEIVRLVALAMSGTSLEVLIFATGYGFFAAVITDFAIHREWRALALSALVPIGMATVPLGLAGIVRRMTPLTYDGTLFAVDASLRVEPARMLGILVNKFPLLRAVSLLSYAALPAAIAAGLAYEEMNSRRRGVRGVGSNVLLAYLITGSITAVLYVWCPGTGPSYAFVGGFPDHLPDPNTVTLGLAPFAPYSPRNAMPSLHFAWAVFLARCTTLATKPVRIAAWSFVLLTILATLGSGEHYLIDLIVAIPFVVALEGATANRQIRWQPRSAAVAVGGALVGLWILVIRKGSVTVPVLLNAPFLMWGLVALTLVACVVVALPAQHVAWDSSTYGKTEENRSLVRSGITE